MQKEKARVFAAKARAAVEAFRPLKVEEADSGLNLAWPLVVKHMIADFYPKRVSHKRTAPLGIFFSREF
jgi:hypothetical protein